MVERDCSTCIYHSQAAPMDHFCMSCLMTPGVPGLYRWEPDVESYMAAIEERHGAPEQSRKESLIEASLNTLSGFLVSYFMWLFVVAPLFGIESNPVESFWITCLFTVVSVARSYVWRRLFVNKFWRTT